MKFASLFGVNIKSARLKITIVLAQALVYPYRIVWIKEFILETKQLQLVRYGYQKDHQTRRQSS
jgi:hypothetical protein